MAPQPLEHRQIRIESLAAQVQRARVSRLGWVCTTYQRRSLVIAMPPAASFVGAGLRKRASGAHRRGPRPQPSEAASNASWDCTARGDEGGIHRLERRDRGSDRGLHLAVQGTTPTILIACSRATSEGDVGKITSRRPAPCACWPSDAAAANIVAALGAGLAEERQRMRQVRRGQPRLFGKALGREVISAAPRRNLADLDQPLEDAAFEVGVGQPQCDVELAGHRPLGDRRGRGRPRPARQASI